MPSACAEQQHLMAKQTAVLYTGCARGAGHQPTSAACRAPSKHTPLLAIITRRCPIDPHTWQPQHMHRHTRTSGSTVQQHTSAWCKSLQAASSGLPPHTPRAPTHTPAQHQRCRAQRTPLIKGECHPTAIVRVCTQALDLRCAARSSRSPSTHLCCTPAANHSLLKTVAADEGLPPTREPTHHPAPLPSMIHADSMKKALVEKWAPKPAKRGYHSRTTSLLWLWSRGKGAKGPPNTKCATPQ